MANLLQQAGAAAEPSSFAPLHTNRIFTGLWTNRSQLRDAATSEYQEKYGMSRQDSIIGGFNSEITPRLTLRRRYGNKIYNANSIPPVNRFYSFNTFTLTNELVLVLADTGMGGGTVYNATAPNLTPVFTKSAGAGTTYFLGVGNTLYFTNGVDNKQWVYNPATGTGTIYDWGIVAPTTAPVATQQPLTNPYPTPKSITGYASYVDISPTGASVPTIFNCCVIVDVNGNVQSFGFPTGPSPRTQQTGLSDPAGAWGTTIGAVTLDGSVQWTCRGNGAWQSSFGYGIGEIIKVSIANPPGTPDQFFIVKHGGMTGTSAPAFGSILGQEISDGSTGLVWKNIGRVLHWSDFGASTTLTTNSQVVDPNGNLQTIYEQGKSGATPPNIWQMEKGALTQDGTAIWQNTGPVSVPSTGPIQYGYAFKNSVTRDVSNMSPKGNPITVIQGNQVTIQGDGSTQGGIDTIVLYRTAVGGSTFLYRDEFPNPAPGVKWTYIDTAPDSVLSPVNQALVGGEGTPLPAGATCLGYHLGRIFAAVGNVVWVSSGPDAINSTSSGNSGFDTFFTAQSKITRFWVCSLGLVVFTVRDAYIILGSATPNDPLYMVVFVEQLPLLHYDAFTINKTTPMLMLGNNMLVALDPSAGIVEIGFPIADRLEEEYDASQAFVTFHTQSSKETALYVANGNGYWYRMNSNNAPEQGSAWSPRANIAGMGCVQSVEVLPGKFLLLWSGTTAGPIMQRDSAVRTDNGATYPALTRVGSIVLAQPGQLAALSFITLESVRVGTRARLALLLGEISSTQNPPDSSKFEELKRTRQDPTNLPPSESLFSDRYHFAQSQQTAWCRHFQMEISWAAEDAQNELLTFTIFGQTWQEMRSQ